MSRLSAVTRAWLSAVIVACLLACTPPTGVYGGTMVVIQTLNGSSTNSQRSDDVWVLAGNAPGEVELVFGWNGRTYGGTLNGTTLTLDPGQTTGMQLSTTAQETAVQTGGGNLDRQSLSLSITETNVALKDGTAMLLGTTTTTFTGTRK